MFMNARIVDVFGCKRPHVPEEGGYQAIPGALIANQ